MAATACALSVTLLVPAPRVLAAEPQAVGQEAEQAVEREAEQAGEREAAQAVKQEAAPEGAQLAPAPAADAAKAGEVSFEPFDDKAFTAAQKSGAPFVLVFEADWCVPCEEMHARTFRDASVLEAAAGVRFLSVDMTKPDRYVELVRESFRVLGAPTCVFFGRDGKEKARRFGFIPPADFVSMIAAARGTAGSAHSVP